MKKIMVYAISALLFCSSAFSSYAISVYVDDYEVPMDVKPVIIDGRTLVPVAAISNALNGDVSWDASTKTVTINRYSKVIQLQLENKTAVVNDRNITLDVPAQSVNGRTMVPVGFIAEAFGESVEWDAQTKSVLIIRDTRYGLELAAPPTDIVETTYKIVRIVDGDTLVINYNGVDEKVRLIGVDTPESVHPDATKNNEFGKIASDFSKNYLDGKEVTLQFDVQERDQYGRILAYVYINGAMYNKTLLQEGMAKVATYPPNVKYVDDFKALEKTARENNKGLWAYANDSTSISTPAAPVVTPNNSTSLNQYTDESGNGLIKGNISSSGEKIYHMPGMRDYNKTKIDTSKGEQWFKTEQEAITAGFRKAIQK